jgi:hypothetical protein
MQKIVELRFDVADEETFKDIMRILEMQLGYIVDNVTITSRDA